MNYLKTLIFICISIAGLSSKAQDAFPALSDNPEWNVFGTDNLWAGEFDTRTYSYLYDTTFCGTQYIKVEASPKHPNNIFAYIREDSNKVYVRTSTSCTDKEFLMYDFTINEGDTILCGHNMSSQTEYWATDIDTISYAGVQRLTLKMEYYIGSPPFQSVASMEWIYGIGSTTHPFYPTVCLDDNCETSYTLLCYNSNGTNRYQNPSYSTCDTSYTVGTREMETGSPLTIYPNPATNEIYIETGLDLSEGGKLEILDMKARTVFSRDIPAAAKGFSQKIDLSSLNKGPYLLSLKTAKNHFTRKITVRQ